MLEQSHPREKRYNEAVMATATKIVYSHIMKDPEVRAGKACIDGTRVSVTDVVWLHLEGYTPEKIREEYPQLNMAQVYAALSYYHEQKEEIESSLKEDENFTEVLDREWEEYVSRHHGTPPDEPAPEDRHIARPFHWPPKR